MEKNRNKIIETLSPYMTLLIVGCFLAAFIFSLINYLRFGFTNPYVISNLIVGFIFIVLFNFRKKLSNKAILIIFLFTTVPFGLDLIIREGFSGNGLNLIGITIIVSVTFLRLRYTLFIILSFILSFVVIVIRHYNDLNYYRDVYLNSQLESEFIEHFIGSVILLLFIVVLISFFKKTQLKNIDLLENNVKELETMNHLLNQKNHDIERMAYINPASGLPNRLYFNNELTDRIHNRESGTLLVADAQNFSHINIFYGVKEGDRIIKHFGKYLSDGKGDSILNVHLDNNAFAFLYDKSLTESEVLDIIAKHEKRIINPLEYPHGIKFNYVCIPEIKQFTTFNHLNNTIEKAMHLIKNDSEKNFVYYEEDHYNIVEEANITEIVKRAISNNDFDVYFQEKFDTSLDKVVGIEALARLFDEGQFISPAIFIPVIERHKLSIEFGWLIIDKVLNLYPTILAKYDKDIRIAINITASHISSDGFIEKMQLLLEKYKIPSNIVELEITESMVMANLDSISQIISTLKLIGITVSIDDFGTGYSSLQYISTLPISVLKIDKSFIDKMLYDSITLAVIKAILYIADAAGFEVIAEGVETVEQMELLKELGCYIIQGYLYSKPKPLL